MNIEPSTNKLSFNPSYELFSLMLCLFALGSLAVRATGSLGPESIAVLEYTDYFICGLFFLDFVRSFYRADNKLRYFASWGWIDLLSSIPVLEPARWGRAARVLRIVRVLRGLRATRIVAEAILRRRSESVFLAACLISFLLIAFSSIAVINFESGQTGANITSAEDALWWAVTTITTVGYGDRFPVSTEGRLVGVLLMLTGVGLFGTLSGFVASWFLQGSAKSNESEIELLRQSIESLRSDLLHDQPKVVVNAKRG